MQRDSSGRRDHAQTTARPHIIASWRTDPPDRLTSTSSPARTSGMSSRWPVKWTWPDRPAVRICSMMRAWSEEYSAFPDDEEGGFPGLLQEPDRRSGRSRAVPWPFPPARRVHENRVAHVVLLLSTPPVGAGCPWAETVPGPRHHRSDELSWGMPASRARPLRHAGSGQRPLYLAQWYLSVVLSIGARTWSTEGVLPQLYGAAEHVLGEFGSRSCRETPSARANLDR